MIVKRYGYVLNEKGMGRASGQWKPKKKMINAFWVNREKPKQLPKRMVILILPVLERMDEQPVNVITQHMEIQKSMLTHTNMM